MDYWQDHPPLHKLAAHYLGVKPRKKQTEAKDVAELLAMFPGGKI